MSPVNFDGNNYLVFLHASHMPFYGSTPSISPLSFAAHSIYSPVHVPVLNSSILRRSPPSTSFINIPGSSFPPPPRSTRAIKPCFLFVFCPLCAPISRSLLPLPFPFPFSLCYAHTPVLCTSLCVCSPSFPISECYHLLVSFLESWGIAGTTCTGSSARFTLISCCEDKDGFKTCEYSASNTNQIAIQENETQ